jgi:hypothetical protein
MLPNPSRFSLVEISSGNKLEYPVEIEYRQADLRLRAPRAIVTREAGQAMTLLYLLALVCGLVPLVTGISIFFLWKELRWPWLMEAGQWTLLGGLLLFVIGMLCLVLYIARSRAERQTSIGRLARQSVLPLCLLLVNFPVAVVLAMAAIDLETRYDLAVHNESQARVTDLALSGGGIDSDLGSLDPGTHLRLSFRIRGEGRLDLTFVQNSSRFETIVDGYVTTGLGGNKLIRILPEGRVVIEDGGA